MDHDTLTAASLRLALLTLAVAVFPASSHADEYSSSVVGTDFDFIRDSDPSAFLCLEYKGRGPREMPDKRGATPLIQEAFIFVSYFSDGTSVDMAIDADFGTTDAARSEAMRYAPRLGRLPTSLRSGVERLVVHEGGENTTAFSDIGLMVLYSGNATRRISTHDLEETLFHESVHAAWDKRHARSSAWREAQTADGAFITRYARSNPTGEDLAESSLFAYTLLHHPERIPAADAAQIARTIPARIAFVRTLLPPNKPIMYQVAPRYECDGTGETFTVDSDDRESEQAGDRPGSDGSSPCDVDITRVGSLSDILSNALMHGLHREEPVVAAFLAKAKVECSSADELLAATASEFSIERSTLDAQVQDFLHCNCSHGDLADNAPESGAAPRAVAVASTGAGELASDSGLDSESIRPILYLIAALVLALLAVNTITLVVLLRQSKAE